LSFVPSYWRCMGQGLNLGFDLSWIRSWWVSQAYEWTTLTADERASVKSQYAAAGIKLVVSAFGATDVPTSSNADPIATANTMAAWVKQYNLDGIDVDYEVCVTHYCILEFDYQRVLLRTLMLSTPAMARRKLGLSISRSSWGRNFLRDSIFLPMHVSNLFCTHLWIQSDVNILSSAVAPW
jgi:hypothetical protein